MDISRRAVFGLPLALWSGKAAMAVKPQGNNILAGTNLAIAQIQSPNFVAGSAGWIIRQNGSAEFNSVTIRGGLVVGGTSLKYNGTPALGNLIASESSAAGTDSFGNAYLSGEAGYSHVGGVWYAVQNGGTGLTAVTAYYTATSAAGPYTLRGFIQADSSGMRITSQSPLILAAGGGAGSVTEALSSGLSGGIPATLLDRTALSAGNDALAHDITATWTIPTPDGSNGAKYTIETFVTATIGPTTAETLTLGLDLDGGGALVPLATLGAAFNGGALSVTYGIPVRLILVPGAGSSAANAQIILSGPLGDTSANRLATNSANMAGFSNTTPFSTGFTHSIALYAQWGGAGGAGQSAGANWSEFTRSGQN